MAACILLLGCESTSSSVPAPGSKLADGEPSARDPAALFELEYALLRAGDADQLWQLFTSRVKTECEILWKEASEGRLFAAEPAEVEAIRSLSPKQFCCSALVPDREAVYRTPQPYSVNTAIPGIAFVEYGEHIRVSQRMLLVNGQWKIDQFLTIALGTYEGKTERDGGVLKVKLPSGNRR